MQGVRAEGGAAAPRLLTGWPTCCTHNPSCLSDVNPTLARILGNLSTPWLIHALS